MAPLDSEPFAFVSSSASSQSVAPEYTNALSQKAIDLDITYTKALREHYPELCLTVCPEYNAPLLDFAALGYASYELDTETESIFRWRGYIFASERGGTGGLGDSVFFAKYHYKWSDQDYILYNIGGVQYILKEPNPDKDEHVLSHCSATDALIKTCAEAFTGDETDYIWVYDGYWYASRGLYEEVAKASWDKVILDSKTKNALVNVTKNFFDSEDVYRRYGVPWRRGLIFYGPPGNGKTISCKALMKDLYERKVPIPTLYVRSATYTYEIGEVFEFARDFSPCLLVMEDIETIVNNDTRSYFFNEVDGLENNDGIMILATTNYIKRLDPGISKRPSRFDRKYRFPLPDVDERTQYNEYWREKLAKDNPDIDFPKKICPALAKITDGFSFAFLQEVFIASLLALARDDQDHGGDDDDDDDDDDDNDARFENNRDIDSEDASLWASSSPGVRTKGKWEPADPLDKYRLWRALKATVKLLREDLDQDLDPEPNPPPEQDEYVPSRKIRSLISQGQSKAPSHPPANPRAAFPREINAQLPFRRPVPFATSPEEKIVANKRVLPGRRGGTPAFSNVRGEVRPLDRLPGAFRGAAGPMGPSRENEERRRIPRPVRPRGMAERGLKQKDDDSEPSNSDMRGAGVGKIQTFAESAYEYVPIG